MLREFLKSRAAATHVKRKASLQNACMLNEMHYINPVPFHGVVCQGLNFQAVWTLGYSENIGSKHHGQSSAVHSIVHVTHDWLEEAEKILQCMLVRFRP